MFSCQFCHLKCYSPILPSVLHGSLYKCGPLVVFAAHTVGEVTRLGLSLPEVTTRPAHQVKSSATTTMLKNALLGPFSPPPNRTPRRDSRKEV